LSPEYLNGVRRRKEKIDKEDRGVGEEIDI
jgi:hypothetical protein